MPVKFIKAFSIYQVGDIVAFDAAKAQEFIARGIAVAYQPPPPHARPSVQHKMVKK